MAQHLVDTNKTKVSIYMTSIKQGIRLLGKISKAESLEINVLGLFLTPQERKWCHTV